MLEELKLKVYEANMELPKRGLVTYTWGNVSGIDREAGLFVIKPSGVEYEELKPEDLIVMDLNGNKVEGTMNPSSDTKHIWFSTMLSLKSVALSTHTALLQLQVHRLDVISRLTVPLMLTISTELYLAPAI